jgi:hypothetical protein
MLDFQFPREEFLQFLWVFKHVLGCERVQQIVRERNNTQHTPNSSATDIVQNRPYYGKT